MQIVIDISENDYNELRTAWKSFNDTHVGRLLKAIYDGQQLPKGHGRLIDEKDLSLLTVHLIDGVFVCNAPTIIEADKEQEDGKNT